MKQLLFFLLMLCFESSFSKHINLYGVQTDTPLIVHHCTDFSVNGKGDNKEWEKTGWTSLDKINKSAKEYKTAFKILYSATGIYVLFKGDDEKITSDYKNDFDNLFNADVFEVFFHPYPSEPVYFEYEVSPLNKELVLLILNRNGKFGGWIPWHYEDKNKVVKKVNIHGGEMKSNATIQSWSAELFFPYKILNPLLNVPPVPGSRWNANFCRLDYDSGSQVMWSWAPIEKSFHEYKKYHSLVFE
jgi:hypothetical protein